MRKLEKIPRYTSRLTLEEGRRADGGTRCRKECEKQNKHALKRTYSFRIVILLTETIAAVNGAVTAGLERNLAGLSALGANGIEHLTAAAATVSTTHITLAGVTAALATLRLVGKALLCKKLLLAGSESKLLAAILASDLLVLEHVVTSFLLVRLISDNSSYG